MADLLPPACPKCDASGGAYQFVERGGSEYAVPCDCARGLALKQRRERRAAALANGFKPVLSTAVCSTAALALTVMPGYPYEDAARAMVADALADLCGSEDELLWVIRRTVQLFQRWPGIPALRHVAWSKFTPLDGQDAIGALEQFPQGIPAEFPKAETTLLLESPVPLPEGKIASVDARVEAAAVVLVAVQDQKDLRFNAPTTPEEIASAPDWLKQIEGYDAEGKPVQ